MLIGIPRGCFYYDYFGFIKRLFDDDKILNIHGVENDEEVLNKGIGISVDEACLPIKLMAGQVETLILQCDKVIVPRVMKDCRGRWLCPKLLGIPELMSGVSDKSRIIITDPLYFNDEKLLKKAMWKVCRKIGYDRQVFNEKFENAYRHQKAIAEGKRKMHVEASWEFVPEAPKEGEIILPNLKTVLLLGHGYNVYDEFTNSQIMKKLDQLGIDTITEREVLQSEKEHALFEMGLIKEPFWEAYVRILGTAMSMKDKVDGIIYLSSFSCGTDALIIEILKNHLNEMPFMVLKLDEHKGEAGFETRLEAFDNMLERTTMKC